ncbi:hypothetical protein HK096_010519, partial [Nowakowskiella sp. JEL0078]
MAYSTKQLLDISSLRKSYQSDSLSEPDLPTIPFSLFQTWFSEQKSNPDFNLEPNAMTLAT